MTDRKRRLPVARAVRAAVPVIALVAAACATRVASYTPPPSSETASLPRPTRVLVADFRVEPGALRQDQGLGPRLQREFGGQDQSAVRSATVSEVRSAISDRLVAALSRSGLPTYHAPPGAHYTPGELVVTGRILRIDEGNRTRRMGIGFGAGESVVEAVAELYGIGPDRSPVLLQSYDGSADSGRKPGLAVGASMAVAESSVAVGALATASDVGGEARRSPIGKEAASLGNRLATDIGSFAAERGWISAAAVPPWTR